MKYTIFRLPKAAHLESMTLDEFCEAFDCSLIVEEHIGSYRYRARLTGIDVMNGRQAIPVSGPEGGPGDPRIGGGSTPEEAICDYLIKLQGRTVTSTQKKCLIKMPQIVIGPLTAIEA